MATTQKINGTLLLLYVDDVAVANSTSFSVSTSMSTREATTKDSAGWMEVLEGLREWGMDGEIQVTYSATFGYFDLWDIYNTRDEVLLKFSTELSGDNFLQGCGWLTDLSKEAGTEETTTSSFSFQGSGPLLKLTQT